MSNPTRKSGASLSPCGVYRWSLHRHWDSALPLLGWVMLNPSTADASKDDPTIRKICGFADRRGFGGIEVRNLFALRSANPDALPKAERPIGFDNDDAIRQMAGECKTIVAAWGTRGTLLGRDMDVMRILKLCGAEIVCLGTTRYGHPCHPLYIHYSQPFVLFDGGEGGGR